MVVRGRLEFRLGKSASLCQTNSVASARQASQSFMPCKPGIPTFRFSWISKRGTFRRKAGSEAAYSRTSATRRYGSVGPHCPRISERGTARGRPGLRCRRAHDRKKPSAGYLWPAPGSDIRSDSRLAISGCEHLTDALVKAGREASEDSKSRFGGHTALDAVDDFGVNVSALRR